MASTVSAAAPRVPARREGVTQARVAASEWVKLRSLRSTLWTLAASVAMTVGTALLLCTIALLNLEGGHGLGTVDPAALSLYGVYLAQLTYGALGVLLATGEYATGQVRSTMTAVPRRLPVLWAKLAVFAVVALVTSEAAAAISMLAGQGILSVRHAGASLADPGVLRAMIGAGLYLTVIGLLSIGLGFIIRNTAGAITILFGMVLVLPIVGILLPSNWGHYITPYLPSNAGMALMQVHPAAGALSPWTGFALFAGYAAAAVVAAAVVLKQRDA
jgi:ABC-2 type transport system permease protein